MTKISNQYSLTNILTADLANSRLGINNVSPTVALDVTGAGRISSSLGVGAAAAYASTTLLVRSNSSTSTNWAFIAEDNATNQIFGIRNNGNVGIGTGSPTAKLEIASSSFQDHLILNRTGIGLMHITATNPRGLAITDGTTQFLTIAQSTGNVGIGTTSPAYKLHISGVAANNIFNMTDTTGYVIHQLSNTSGSFYYAIDNSAGGAIGNGAYVRHIYSNGAYPIVITTNDVERLRITSGGNVGIGNTAFANTRLTITGISTTSSNYGLVVNNSSNSNLFLVRDDGAVTVIGSLSKGSGSFRIDHPLKPDTHQLVHSFIEGPQADLIYRGKLTLVNGKAQANIDEVSTMTEGTFEALCREVQCFTTNENGWDLVKGKVIGNIIYIESQNPNSTDEISWMVIGERKDKHMMDTGWTDEQGKVIVEPLKA